MLLQAHHPMTATYCAMLMLVLFDGDDVDSASREEF